jgi:hypothetical protein
MIPARRDEPTLVEQIDEWVAAQIGPACPKLDPSHRFRILATLQETETTLDDWRLVVTSAPDWTRYATRTEREQRAVRIGESYNPRSLDPERRRRRVFFLVPNALD